MTLFFALLAGGFAVAVVVALVRGLIAFFKDAEQIRQNGAAPSEGLGVKQNQMMIQRVLFQGIAVFLIVLAGMLAS